MKLTLIASVDRRRDQRGRRDDHRLGPRPRRVPGQEATSTRSSTCRSRCRRSSPASPCWRSTATTAILGIGGVSFTKIGVVMALAVRDAARSWSGRCSRCCSSSTRTWRRPPPRSAPGPLTIFRRIVLPNLAPAIIRRRRARVRPRGRRVRLADPDLGQHPVRHRGRLGLHLQPGRGRQRRPRAAAVSVVLLAVSVGVLFLINFLGRGSVRHEQLTTPPSVSNRNIVRGGRGTRLGLRRLRARLPGGCS